MKKIMNLRYFVLFLMSVPVFFGSCNQTNVAPPEAIGPVPDERQVGWHEMEQNAFIHFTMNTFTDKEWGYGDESPELFNPTDFDADQWVSVLNETGFKGVILTCKHHDGFCLWPTAYTEHSVKNTPFMEGKGDIVKAVSDACRKYGLKFGVYLSPWDRNRADYAQPSYIEYYRNQLKELFTNYGPVFEMWFDGANGGDGYYGGAREKRQIDRQTYYDWPATLDLVSSMQPQVVFFSDAGPDIRWCGNERGVMGETNWNTISVDTLYAGKSGITELLNTGSEDGNKWVPGEVDTSIRPGWFYHAKEDSLVKTSEKLFDIYLTSVGRGSNLLLNIPPDRRGKFHENDVQALRGFKAILDSTFATNLALGANVKASEVRGNSSNYAAQLVVDGDKNTYWTTNDETYTGNLEIDLGEEKTIKFVQIQEYIQLGQRVKAFTVEAWKENSWQKVAEGTTIGYKRILKTEPFTTSKVKISITESKACPVISSVSLY
ncbi:MAG: alpha-L-fucosidase [Mangrovibacterium sp.]